MSRNFISQEILELVNGYYNHKSPDDGPVSEDDSFISDLTLDEWEYLAFVNVIEMQMGVKFSEKETKKLYSRNLKALIDLLCKKLDS